MMLSFNSCKLPKTRSHFFHCYNKCKHKK